MSKVQSVGIEFDQNKTPEENIEIFLAHLDTLDPEMSQIFKSNIENLLAEHPRSKVEARKKFSAEAKRELKEIEDKLSDTTEGSK